MGQSGRGYAALSCQDEFDWNAKQSIRKIMDRDIGEMSSGQHSLRIQGQTCTVLIGNYSWGQSGRGYAAMDCVFD